MTDNAARLTEETVRPALTLVNRLVPMVSEGSTDEGEDAPGRQLERFVKDRWPRSKGGMRGLAKQIGVVPETLYAWFRGDSEPSMAHMREMAPRLDVTRSQIVAILDNTLAGAVHSTRSAPADPPSPDPLLVELRDSLRQAQRERADLRERVAALEAAAKLRDQSDDGADDASQARHQTGGSAS